MTSSNNKSPVKKPITVLASAVKVAESKAVETAKMQTRVGRASYVSSEKLTPLDPECHVRRLKTSIGEMGGQMLFMLILAAVESYSTLYILYVK